MGKSFDGTYYVREWSTSLDRVAYMLDYENAAVFTLDDAEKVLETETAHLTFEVEPARVAKLYYT